MDPRIKSRIFTLMLVRHGQTTHNKLKIIQGQMETNLTDLGRDQAKLLSEYFQKTNEQFDKVYSSDLIRAYETCQIVCNGKYDIVKDKLLRERSFGVLQGSPLEMLRSEAYKRGHSESNYTQYRPEGGETLEDVRARIEKFCQEVLFPIAKNNMKILIVTHGGVIRSFMNYFRKHGCSIENRDFIITPNTAFNRFEIKIDEDNEIRQVVANALHKIPHLSNQAKSEALSEEQLNDSTMKEEEHAI